jgi:hypothetical protein
LSTLLIYIQGYKKIYDKAYKAKREAGRSEAQAKSDINNSMKSKITNLMNDYVAAFKAENKEEYLQLRKRLVNIYGSESWTQKAIGEYNRTGKYAKPSWM